MAFIRRRLTVGHSLNGVYGRWDEWPDGTVLIDNDGMRRVRIEDGRAYFVDAYFVDVQPLWLSNLIGDQYIRRCWKPDRNGA
jgi:hypothetical protein